MLMYKGVTYRKSGSKFYTKDFFWNLVVPDMARLAKKNGSSVQCSFSTDFNWSIRTTKDQPTHNAFAIVSVKGKVTEGPKFDPSFRR